MDLLSLEPGGDDFCSVDISHRTFEHILVGKHEISPFAPSTTVSAALLQDISNSVRNRMGIIDFFISRKFCIKLTVFCKVINFHQGN